MSVYEARIELDTARRKLNRLEWRLAEAREDGRGLLQRWYKARYWKRRMVWETKRKAWEEAVREYRGAIGTEEGSNV